MDNLTLVPALFNLGTGEIILIVAVVLLLFGGKKIPELARGLGKGVRSFKEGINEVQKAADEPAATAKGDADDTK